MSGEGVRLDPKGPLVPWSEFCKKWGHYYRPDGTCVCGAKRPVHRRSKK